MLLVLAATNKWSNVKSSEDLMKYNRKTILHSLSLLPKRYLLNELLINCLDTYRRNGGTSFQSWGEKLKGECKQIENICRSTDVASLKKRSTNLVVFLRPSLAKVRLLYIRRLGPNVKSPSDSVLVIPQFCQISTMWCIIKSSITEKRSSGYSNKLVVLKNI